MELKLLPRGQESSWEAVIETREDKGLTQDNVGRNGEEGWRQEKLKCAEGPVRKRRKQGSAIQKEEQI